MATAAVGNKGAKESYCFSIAEDLPIGAVKVEVSKQGFIDHTMVSPSYCLLLKYL